MGGTTTASRRDLELAAVSMVQRELQARQDARGRLLAFTRYTRPGYAVGPHHRLICDKLQEVEQGRCRRLMIFTPPRHGKSELVSRRFPAWYLGRNPRQQIISASYGQNLADDFGRDVRNIVQSPEYARLFPETAIAADSAARNRWNTSQGGSYIAAGVGTAVTGRGADVLNLDDPVKDRQEADSKTVRDGVWNWYTSTAYTRLMPGGAVILTMTRWHEDDLAGRLLAEMETGGDQWDIIDLPAINAAGEALWPDWYGAEALATIRAAIGERDWSSLYMQRPRPAEGSLFQVARIETLDGAPAVGATVRAWDQAATAQVGSRDPDWTAGVKMRRTPEGRYVILDVARLRGGPDEVEAAIVNTAAQDGRGVRVSLPQDPGQAGKALAFYLTRRLAGYVVESKPVTGDKSTRAAPFASQVNVGNVSVVRAPWNRAFLDELGGFPGATHDDQVDAAADGFGMLVEPPRPARWIASLLRVVR